MKQALSSADLSKRYLLEAESFALYLEDPNSAQEMIRSSCAKVRSSGFRSKHRTSLLNQHLFENRDPSEYYRTKLILLIKLFLDEATHLAKLSHLTKSSKKEFSQRVSTIKSRIQ